MKVSCIIPAYNEGAKIGSVLAAVTPLLTTALQEIIVVDDGSSDNTQEVVRTFPHVTLVVHEKNEGKSKTIVDGIRRATGEYILMIDGDLIGLQRNNILDLINPVTERHADITISYRGNTPKWWIRTFKIETFSGERCFSKDFITPHLAAIAALPSYGLEAFINTQILAGKLRIQSVPMAAVRIDFKWHRHGLWLGIWKEILMWRDILSVVGPVSLMKQVYGMKKLIVRN